MTDLPASRRRRLRGIDNRAAGATAAYLVEQWLGTGPATCSWSRGHGSFRGEDERETGFRAEMLRAPPRRRWSRWSTTRTAPDAVHVGDPGRCSAEHPTVRAVYSLYAGAGGNAAVVDAFAAAGRPYRRLRRARPGRREHAPCCASGQLSAVLHHDLRQDLRRACQAILQAQRGAARPDAGPTRRAIQVMTPHNVPPLLPWPDS